MVPFTRKHFYKKRGQRCLFCPSPPRQKVTMSSMDIQFIVQNLKTLLNFDLSLVSFRYVYVVL